MTQGVCYFLCGGGRRQKWRRYLAPLVTSLHSLRQHYDGPVCVLLGEDVERHSLPCGVLSYFNYTKTVPLATGCRHTAYVTKASLWRHSPFEQTVFLDCDTAACGRITELFAAPLTTTNFCEWNTGGGIIGGRVGWWRNIVPDRVREIQAAKVPAINTGVVGWNHSKAESMLIRWEELTRKGHSLTFTDELAMQLLWPDFEKEGGVMLDDRFNCSGNYGVPRDDVRIWHFHGRKMIPGKGKPQGPEIYRPHLVAAIEANAGRIADWLRDVDPALWELAQ